LRIIFRFLSYYTDGHALACQFIAPVSKSLQWAFEMPIGLKTDVAKVLHKKTHMNLDLP